MFDNVIWPPYLYVVLSRSEDRERCSAYDCTVVKFYQ
jgi:hypothetical protein